MYVKIKGKDAADLEINIDRVMNLACMAFRRGRLLRDYDMENRRRGEFWYREGNTFELYPTLNNDKAFVRNEGELFIVVEFYSRYDSKKKKSIALSNLIAALFVDDVELIND